MLGVGMLRLLSDLGDKLVIIWKFTYYLGSACAFIKGVQIMENELH